MIVPGALYLSTVLTNALLVLKDSALKQAADLNGKTIATRDLANMSYLGARAWLDKNGGDSNSVHWLEIADPQHVAAMQSGRIAAASVGEPALDDALRGGQVKALGRVFDAIAPRFLIAGFFTTESFARTNSDIAAKFASVVTQASHWANQRQNHAQSGQMLEKYAMAPVLPDSTRIVYAEQTRAADIQPVLNLLLTYGFLKEPMRAGELVSPLAHGT